MRFTYFFYMYQYFALLLQRSILLYNFSYLFLWWIVSVFLVWGCNYYCFYEDCFWLVFWWNHALIALGYVYLGLELLNHWSHMFDLSRCSEIVSQSGWIYFYSWQKCKRVIVGLIAHIATQQAQPLGFELPNMYCLKKFKIWWINHEWSLF